MGKSLTKGDACFQMVGGRVPPASLGVAAGDKYVGEVPTSSTLLSAHR